MAHVTFIKTIADVRKWFKELYEVHDVAFHPDDDFKQYVEIGNGKRVFADAQAKKYNKMMGDAFKVCKKAQKDIYEIGMSEMQKYTKKLQKKK